MERRSFIKDSSAISIGSLVGLSLLSCKDKAENTSATMSQKTLDISLAQWSLNRAFFAKELNVNDFAHIASKDYQIQAVEYVNQFYVEHAKDEIFWQEMKRKADDAGVKNLLVMVDAEGNLGNTDDQERKQAAENHFKWVNAAKLLGCHSIRVNAFGEGNKEDVRSALVDGMSRLVDYAATENINVIIENHGLYSSDGKWIAGIIKEVNKPNFGTLPDFGNWCLNAEWGSMKDNGCTEVYDPYQGLKDFLPYAKGVSAKAYSFDADGNESIINYKQMLDLVKASEFEGYIGIEYEGETLNEPDGIRATKQLLEKYI